MAIGNKVSAVKEKPKKGLSKTAFRKLWVESLRSGKYRKIRGALKKNGRYCCLGVACELYNQNFPEPLEVGEGNSSDGTKSFDGEDSTLPGPVQEALGISNRSGTFEISVKTKKESLRETLKKIGRADQIDYVEEQMDLIDMDLIQLNDDYEFTFNQIADVIECSPKGLFD